MPINLATFLNEMDESLERHKLSKLRAECSIYSSKYIKIPNSYIYTHTLKIKKDPGSHGFTDKFHQTVKEEIKHDLYTISYWK